MTAVDAPPEVEPVSDPPTAVTDEADGPTFAQRLPGIVFRWVVIIFSTLVIFSAFLIAKGADPASVLEAMWKSALGTPDSIGETLIRTTPILLAALAAAVPARAGLFNLGGEGQLLLGAIGAIVMANRLDGAAPGPLTLVLMALGAAAFGAAWAAIPALLKVLTRTNEAI